MSCRACSCSALPLPLPRSIPPHLEHLVAAGVFHLYAKRLPLHKSLVRQWCEDTVSAPAATLGTGRERSRVVASFAVCCTAGTTAPRIGTASTVTTHLQKDKEKERMDERHVGQRVTSFTSATLEVAPSTPSMAIVDALMLGISKTLLLMLRKRALKKAEHESSPTTRRGHAARQSEVEARGEKSKQTDAREREANASDLAQASGRRRFHHECSVGRLLSIRLTLEDPPRHENRHNSLPREEGKGNSKEKNNNNNTDLTRDHNHNNNHHHPMRPNGVCFEEVASARRVVLSLTTSHAGRNGKGHEEDEGNQQRVAILLEGKESGEEDLFSSFLHASDAGQQKHRQEQRSGGSTRAPPLLDDPFSCLWFDDSCCCLLLLSSGGDGDLGDERIHHNDSRVGNDRGTVEEKDEEKVPKAAEGSLHKKEKERGDYANGSNICIPIGTMLAHLRTNKKKDQEGSSGGDTDNGQKRDGIVVGPSYRSPHVRREVVPLLTIPPPLPLLSSSSGTRSAPQTLSPMDLTFTQQQAEEEGLDYGGGDAAGYDNDNDNNNNVSTMRSSPTSSSYYPPPPPSPISLFPIPCSNDPTCHFCTSYSSLLETSANNNTSTTMDPAGPPLHLTFTSSSSTSPSFPFPFPFPPPEFLLAVYNHSLQDVLAFVIERTDQRRRSMPMNVDHDHEVNDNANKDKDQLYTRYWSSFLANYEPNGPTGNQFHPHLRPKVRLKIDSEKSERSNKNSTKTRAATTTACSPSRGVLHESGKVHVLAGRAMEAEEEEEVANSKQTATVGYVADTRSVITFDEERKETTSVTRARKANGGGGEPYSGESVKQGQKREREGESERGNEGHHHALVENGDEMKMGAQLRGDGQPAVIVLMTQPPPRNTVVAKIEIDDDDDDTSYGAQKANEIANRFVNVGSQYREPQSRTKKETLPARALDHSTSFATSTCTSGLRSETAGASTSSANTTTSSPILRTRKNTRNDNVSHRICVSLDEDDDHVRATHDGASKHKTNSNNTHKHMRNVGREKSDADNDDDEVLLID